MKKILLMILTLLLMIPLGVKVYAQVIEVLDGYKQVTKQGGENDTNTAGAKDGVVVNKTIAETELENYFDITLSVKTSSRVDEIIKDQDLAIVIVMDVSQTMVDGKAGTVTRYEAAMAAGEALIDDFAKFSTGTSATRQLGFVAFNTNGHEIFKLQGCKSADIATTLKNDMKSKTNAIVTASDYKSAHSRFTNIEVGLQMAQDMLAKSNVKNKYIILLTDGFPTTYIKSGYTGYDPYMSEKSTLPTSSTANGNFYNEIHKLPCLYGTDYSDRAAIKARKLATTIKSSGTTIFSVGVGLSNQKSISYYMTEDSKRVNNTGDKKFATVDTETTSYEIGNSSEDYKKWLQDSIGSGYYYNSENTAELKAAYAEIFEKVKEMSETASQATWVAEDPMGVDGNVKNIEFLGLFDDRNNASYLYDSLNNKNENQSDTASFTNNKISWDLKKSAYQTMTEGNTTYYLYEVKYRIRLENEDANFSTEKIYDTNGRTTLTYVVRNGGVLSENKTIDFPIPQVVGYLGNFSFTKKSSFNDRNLAGAKFKLVHDENCECHTQKKYATINDFEVTSLEDGTVSFDRIPSGHKYKLIEVDAPADFIISEAIHNIVVAYGETTGTPEENIIKNDPKLTNLILKKVVNGEDNNQSGFKFTLHVWYQGNELTGTYNYNVNGGEIKQIELGKHIITLKHNQAITIYDLPVGSTYKITETTTDGYHVQYQINAKPLTTGNTASCDSDCRLEEGENSVKFINTTSYILPETGSSGMLILTIIGSLLFVTPIINLGYMRLKRKGSIKN